MLSLEIYKYIKEVLRDRPIASAAAEASHPGIRTFSDGTRSVHVVTGEAECRAALTQPQFRQPDFAALLRTALPRGGTTSCIAAEFFETNPINLDGEAHRAARQRFLVTLNALRKTMRPGVESLARRSLAALADAEHRASIPDTCTKFVDGVVGHLLGQLGVPASEAAPWSGGSACIFEFFPSGAMLRKKEDQVRRFLASLRDAPPVDTAIVLSFILQGRDPMLGGLCAFLAGLARAEPDARAQRLTDTDGLRLFRATAPVNYIGRFATSDTEIGEYAIAAGDEVVIMLGLTGGSGLAFGAGAHVCAGQALAIDVTDCWLGELRRVADRVNWPGLRAVRSVPAVFQQYEDIAFDDAPASS
jgi:cytochrome P450